MSVDKLESAINSIEWESNIAAFLALEGIKKEFAQGNYTLALWSKQLEQIDEHNPALSFIREMQLSGQQAVALTALGLYKPAAASIRAMIEAALYFTYFRTHPVELNTLHRDKSFWISKTEILIHLKTHSINCKELQNKLGFIANLEQIYKHLSAIVHGQLPGVWSHKSFKKTSTVEATVVEVKNTFVNCVSIIHRFFLCTVAQEHWDDFSADAKKLLLKGLPGDDKNILNLDDK